MSTVYSFALIASLISLFLFLLVFWLVHRKVISRNLGLSPLLTISQIRGNRVKPMRTIRIPWFDNSDLIRCLNKTLIGRITNPDTQNVGSLVSMMPKIWKLDDDRVTGKDLGLGKFRFDFKREEDILEVLKTEPFSFNQWMVSIVRWEPVVHKNYPSDITFWVTLVGVPTPFW
ncbi:uncharacterized protein LOC117133343 [Brassica rapa]|uniref:uncharacterized protein LOC117133343 n=1 Tax=Brassica campestris TaxID=3711 RepID=UPI00142DA34D|nr:uncharacterized protein LOC117133343 [Brassica rapa]